MLYFLGFPLRVQINTVLEKLGNSYFGWLVLTTYGEHIALSL